jgi:hypothetical protein
MTESEKKIIEKVQRVFPEVTAGAIMKTIYETKLQVAGKLDECERHHITGGSDLKIYVDKTGDWISLNEAREKILNKE